MARRYNVKYRLDGVLLELQGVKAESLAGAIEAGRNICLMGMTREYKGMTLDHLSGQPRVVGVETPDAWDE